MRNSLVLAGAGERFDFLKEANKKQMEEIIALDKKEEPEDVKPDKAEVDSKSLKENK